MLSKKFTIDSIPRAHDTEHFNIMNFSIAKVNTIMRLLSLTFQQNLEYGYCCNHFSKHSMRSILDQTVIRMLMNRFYEITRNTRLMSLGALAQSIQRHPRPNLGGEGETLKALGPQKRPDCP